MLQFRKIAQANNSKFISGFQSWIYSKSDISDKEKKCLVNYYRYYENIFSNIFDLQELYSKKYLNDKKEEFIINIHNKFKKLNPKITHFGDVVHTLEPGDEEIAKIYYEKIIKIYE